MPDPAFLSGLELQQAGQYAQAEAHWRGLLEDRPGEALILAQLAVCRFWQEAREEGLALMDQALAARPGDGGLHHMAAALHLEIGATEPAVAHLRQAAAAAADNAALMTLVVDDLIRLGRLDDAAEAAGSMAAEEAVTPPGRALAAKAALIAAQPAKALELAAAAHAASPFDPMVLEAYGAAAILVGDTAAEAAALDTAAQMPPELCERLFLIWAKLLEINGCTGQALGFVRSLAQAGSDSLTVLVDHARLALAEGAVEEARASLDRALKLSPQLASALLLLGEVHVQQGQPAKAVPVLRRALNDNPKLVDAYRLLARLDALNSADQQRLSALAADPGLAASARRSAADLLASLG